LIPLVLSSFVENYILNTNRKLNENLATIESQFNLLFQDNQLKTKLLSILPRDLHSPTTSLSSILDLSNKATINPDEFNDLKLRIKGQLETTEHILDNTLNWIKH
jgi:K+-sensing histidine kinase KdpD